MYDVHCVVRWPLVTRPLPPPCLNQEPSPAAKSVAPSHEKSRTVPLNGERRSPATGRPRAFEVEAAQPRQPVAVRARCGPFRRRLRQAAHQAKGPAQCIRASDQRAASPTSCAAPGRLRRGLVAEHRGDSPRASIRAQRACRSGRAAHEQRPTTRHFRWRQTACHLRWRRATSSHLRWIAPPWSDQHRTFLPQPATECGYGGCAEHRSNDGAREGRSLKRPRCECRACSASGSCQPAPPPTADSGCRARPGRRAQATNRSTAATHL